MKLKWKKEPLVDIYWSSSKNYLHSLYYDEDYGDYTWYTHRLEDIEELKKELLYPPIVTSRIIEAESLRDAMRLIEEEYLYQEELEEQHPELVDELLKGRLKTLKEWQKEIGRLIERRKFR